MKLSAAGPGESYNLLDNDKNFKVGDFVAVKDGEFINYNGAIDIPDKKALDGLKWHYTYIWDINDNLPY